MFDSTRELYTLAEMLEVYSITSIYLSIISTLFHYEAAMRCPLIFVKSSKFN